VLVHNPSIPAYLEADLAREIDLAMAAYGELEPESGTCESCRANFATTDYRTKCGRMFSVCDWCLP
jgi:hypothetical protein